MKNKLRIPKHIRSLPAVWEEEAEAMEFKALSVKDRNKHRRGYRLAVAMAKAESLRECASVLREGIDKTP